MLRGHRTSTSLRAVGGRRSFGPSTYLVASVACCLCPGALLFHRSNPTLGTRVQIRTLGRKHERFHPSRGQRRPERGTKHLVPVVHNVSASIRITSAFLGRSPGELLHRLTVRMPGDSSDDVPDAFPGERRTAHTTHYMEQGNRWSHKRQEPRLLEVIEHQIAELTASRDSMDLILTL